MHMYLKCRFRMYLKCRYMCTVKAVIRHRRFAAFNHLNCALLVPEQNHISLTQVWILRSCLFHRSNNSGNIACIHDKVWSTHADMRTNSLRRITLWSRRKSIRAQTNKYIPGRQRCCLAEAPCLEDRVKQYICNQKHVTSPRSCELTVVLYTYPPRWRSCFHSRCALALCRKVLCTACVA